MSLSKNEKQVATSLHLAEVSNILKKMATKEISPRKDQLTHIYKLTEIALMGITDDNSYLATWYSGQLIELIDNEDVDKILNLG